MRDPTRLQPISAINERARAFFKTDATLPYAFRMQKLQALGEGIRKLQPRILEAMKTDLGKSEVEAYVSEVGVVMKDIGHTQRHLKKWMKQRRVPTSQLLLLPARSSLVAEPLGAVLIIAPWNYPVNLLLAPLVGAISAGCTAVLKPSELTPSVEQVMGELIQDVFGDDGYVTLVKGGPAEAEKLLAEKWDHIFFTGSTRIGKVVMAAAAKHLTPVTLELGGKNPTLVDTGADLTVTGRRIAWGRAYNAGQTCLATDYVLVPHGLKDQLVQAIIAGFKEFYGDDPAQSPNYSKIVNAHHVRRLKALLDTGRIAYGGNCDEATRYFQPTIVVDPAMDSALMADETFGPILPVIGVDSWTDAVNIVRERPKPLALYAFSNDAAHLEEARRRTSSGALVINDAIVHFASDDLPFGGVGDSGMGGYHGKASFDSFSHHKPVLKRYFFGDLALRYPHGKGTIEIWKRLLG
jgi:aldehyde dehydrogenase (NAD+)